MEEYIFTQKLLQIKNTIQELQQSEDIDLNVFISTLNQISLNLSNLYDTYKNKTWFSKSDDTKIQTYAIDIYYLNTEIQKLLDETKERLDYENIR